MSFVLLMLGRGIKKIAPRWRQDGAISDSAIVLRRVKKTPEDTEQLQRRLGWVAESAGKLAAARDIYGGSDLEEKPTWMLQRLGAVSYLLGDLESAIGCYQELVCRYPDQPLFHLISGELQYHGGGLEDAAFSAVRAINQLTDENRTVEQVAAEGASWLSRGRFVLAGELFMRGIERCERLLQAYGLLLAIRHRTMDSAAAAMVSLANLRDAMIRQRIRAQFAGQLCVQLQKINGRFDLATWASGGRVTQLLEYEYARAVAETAQHPAQVPLLAHAGLVARVCNQRTQAADWFGRTLLIHPHHGLAASNLAATLLELGHDKAAQRIMTRALRISSNAARQHYNLALAYGNAEKFERALTVLFKNCTGAADISGRKANLGVALATLGLFDDSLEDALDQTPVSKTAR